VLLLEILNLKVSAIGLQQVLLLLLYLHLHLLYLRLQSDPLPIVFPHLLLLLPAFLLVLGHLVLEGRVLLFQSLVLLLVPEEILLGLLLHAQLEGEGVETRAEVPLHLFLVLL